MADMMDKMKLDAGADIWLINAPAGIAASFQAGSVRQHLSGKTPVAQLLAFVTSAAEIEQLMTRLSGRLTENARLWIAFPKRSGTIKSDISRDNGWDAMHTAGYEETTLVAVDTDWSALRFRHSSVKAPYIPPQDRDIEGIDFVNRTVALPADVLEQMKKYRGLAAFFDSMSFTHKKEYAEAIATAKKPETRQRRIEKMIEMVSQLKTQKEQKKK